MSSKYMISSGLQLIRPCAEVSEQHNFTFKMNAISINSRKYNNRRRETILVLDRLVKPRIMATSAGDPAYILSAPARIFTHARND